MSDPIGPAGSSEAGTWEADDLPPQAPRRGFLADALDATGELTSITTGRHPIDAEVEFLLRARFGRGAALGGHGTKVASIRKLGDGWEMAVRYELEDTLRVPVKRGDIRIEKILTSRADAFDVGAALLVYTNLLTAEERRVQV